MFQSCFGGCAREITAAALSRNYPRWASSSPAHAVANTLSRRNKFQMQKQWLHRGMASGQLSKIYRPDMNIRLFTSYSNQIINAHPRHDRPTNKCNKERSFWRKAFKPIKPTSQPSKFNYKIDFDHTVKSLQGIHQYVKNNLSLDLWTINLLLLGFVAGPSIYNAMKNSPHTEDDYMFSVPVDDPVEHSVRILMELNDKSDSSLADEEKLLLKSTFNNPEDDAKRILNDLLASEHLRTTASRIASGVIQSPPFQNACKALVNSIWNDLVNDPETNKQLVALVQSVLQNERVYDAVKEMMLKLVNDEEVYKELTKLVVQLGEEKDVLDATQRLLTESTHKTLNDPSVLDHSMEFATEVVGDDVVQRSGGEALRNTLGYAVQPSTGAVLASLTTMIVAGLIHFYFFRSGRSIDEGWLSPRPSFDSLSSNRNRSFSDSVVGESNVFSSIYHGAVNVVSSFVSFPVLLVRSMYNGICNVCSYPIHMYSYSLETVTSCVTYISAIPNIIWLKLVSFPSWVGVSGKYYVSSLYNCALARIKNLRCGAANVGRSCADSIDFTSKTTKGAMIYIVATIKTSIAHLLSTMRSKWSGSRPNDTTEII